MSLLAIKNIGKLLTCAGSLPKAGSMQKDIGVLENVAVLCENGVIKEIVSNGNFKKLETANNWRVIDAAGKVVMPGFVDAHTHFVFAGERSQEMLKRLSGMSYIDIMQQGGGIASTVKSTKDATMEELLLASGERLAEMAQLGITTIEGKSGYGLDWETEHKQLETMKVLNSLQPVEIVLTYMGAHAIPNNFSNDADGYIDWLVNEVLPKLSKDPAIDFVDIFCEKKVFNVEQSRRFLQKASGFGFKLKIHAEEIERTGGAKLAAELKAVSADHLLRANKSDIVSLAEHNVIAVLLPITAFLLKENYANARMMIDNNLAVAVASDFNPGSCPTFYIPLLIALCCIHMHMSIEEVIVALTINAAFAINRGHKVGSIEVGKQADLVVLKCTDYKFLLYNLGMNMVDIVIKKGEIIVTNNKQEAILV